ncbi:hypothetical protein OEZ85_012318 [Tetradesmus obliquus]|uniref:Peptidase M20 dimerisation domain-containing protein n=1 Tax=Tetradesmus obliquus TaxID=3088 RepID=A0ABY8TSY9_TETOB|nr:hypothetical protein OEZ85_012318 [Tetradesmus obliquus]
MDRKHRNASLLVVILALGWHASATSTVAAAASVAHAREYAAANKDAFLRQLLDLASIASISALPQHNKDILKAADWLQQHLNSIGLENVQALETEGPQPVVYADWLHAPGKPTVLVYGHYDVQPVDPLDLWTSPPFEPQLQQMDGQSYFVGRGVDDDKGGLLQALQGMESFLRTSQSLPLNVKFILEGQEEIGSPNLEAFLIKHKAGLLAGIDMAISADGGQVAADQPGIGTGLRGAVAFEVEVSTAGMDLHSGMKGGSVQNANHALVALLASLKDADNRITVPGFYDDVAAMAAEDKASVAAFPFDKTTEQRALGVLGFMGEAGFGPLEHRWYRPTLEVVGMWGGFTGAGMKTVIPRVANAKLSCRLVPNMSPDDIAAKVKAHLERKGAELLANVTVTVSGFRSYPWTSPRDTPGNVLSAGVLEAAMGRNPFYYRDGGTIPALAYFQQVLGLNSTIFAFGLGDHIHAPNERLLEHLFHTGRKAWVEYLAVLGDKLAGLLPPDAPVHAGSGAGRDEL